MQRFGNFGAEVPETRGAGSISRRGHREQGPGHVWVARQTHSVAGVDPNLAVAITGAVGILSPLILSGSAWRRQQAEHREARAREEREHLRSLLEDGARALRQAYGALKPTTRHIATVEEATEALRALGAVNGRLPLYLPLEHPVADAFDHATAMVYGLSQHGGDLHPAGAPTAQPEPFESTAETERLEQEFDTWLNRYYAACRELLEAPSGQ